MITQERLREVLDYDPHTGEFTWKLPTSQRVKKGRSAGSKTAQGYLSVTLDGGRFLAHRLVWLYEYGYIPENEVDHLNRNRSDNRLHNLREVTRSCNMRNTRCGPRNKSGVKGVYLRKKSGKWKAEIMIMYKTYNLGEHINFSEAVCHRLAGEQALNWSGCDSSSPAFKYVSGLLAR